MKIKNIYRPYKSNIQNFNTDRVLWWRLILEEYGPDIKYILGEKNVSAYVPSQLTNNGNQKNTHKSKYLTETMLELYNTKEPPEGMFLLPFKIIGRYQQEDPVLTKKLTCIEYKKGSFRGGINTLKLVTIQNIIVIPQIIQKYVVK